MQYISASEAGQVGCLNNSYAYNLAALYILPATLFLLLIILTVSLLYDYIGVITGDKYVYDPFYMV